VGLQKDKDREQAEGGEIPLQFKENKFDLVGAEEASIFLTAEGCGLD